MPVFRPNPTKLAMPAFLNGEKLHLMLACMPDSHRLIVFSSKGVFP